LLTQILQVSVSSPSTLPAEWIWALLSKLYLASYLRLDFSMAWSCLLSSVSVAQYNMPARSTPGPKESAIGTTCCHPQATISADLEQIMSKSRKNLSTLNFSSIAQGQRPQSEALSLPSTESNEYTSQSYPGNLATLKTAFYNSPPTAHRALKHSVLYIGLLPISISHLPHLKHIAQSKPTQTSMVRQSLQYCFRYHQHHKILFSLFGLDHNLAIHITTNKEEQ